MGREPSIENQLPATEADGSLATDASRRNVISEHLYPDSAPCFASIDAPKEVIQNIQKVYCKDQSLEDFFRKLGAPQLSQINISELKWGSYAVEVKVPLCINEKKATLSYRLDIPKEGPSLGDAVLFSIAIRKDNGNAVSGQGIGTSVFAQMVNGLAELGFEYIHCIAERRGDSNGYYTWPRIGFDSSSRENLRSAKRGGIVSADGSEITSLLDIMETEKGREHWRMYGKRCEVSFDLRNGSRSWKVFSAYLREKRAGCDVTEFCEGES